MDKKIIFKTYIAHLTPYKLKIGVLIFVTGLIAGITVPIPKIYSILIDQVLPDKDIYRLFIFVSLIVGVFILEAVLSFTTTILGAQIKKEFRSNMRAKIYSKVQRLPYEKFSNYVSSDLVVRLTRDLDTLGVLLPKGIANFLKNSMLIVGFVSLLLWMNWKLTIISGVMIPLFFLVFIMMSKKLSEKAKENFKIRSKMQFAFQEKIEGNRDIRLTHSFDYQQNHISGIIKESESAVQNVVIQDAKMSSVFALLAILSSFILWGIGGYWTIQNMLTIGEIIAFSYAFNYLFTPISSIFSFFSNLSIELEALKRIFELFQIEDDMNLIRNGNFSSKINGYITFQNVHFNYKDSPSLLENINLKIKPGTTTCIVGENGIGKSTLVSLILNLYQPLSGEVLIDNISAVEYSEQSLRQQVALIPQQVFLFQGSIKDNILMGRQVTAQHFFKACQLSGVSAYVEKLKDGLDTIVSEKGNNLSGGEKQKIAIARALVDNPQILLLDEPTNHLDEAVKASIQQGILLAKEGKTIILITHDMSLLEGIDSVYELKNKTLTKKDMNLCLKK